MYDISALPAVNAALNGTAAVLLAAGRLQIARKRVSAHRAIMISALACSIAFLACYLYYHAHTGMHRFVGAPSIRFTYLAILLTHTVLAAALVPLVLITLSRALRARFDRHRVIARWTWPIWMYVSVTGVVVYFMLYHISGR